MSSRKLENAHLSTCLGRQVVGSGLGLQRRRNLNSLVGVQRINLGTMVE